MATVYTEGAFEQDVKTTARTMHLAYRRAKYLMERWYGGMNLVDEDPDTALVMNRCDELITDYEANSNAKLNTIMNKSDLALPGDGE